MTNQPAAVSHQPSAISRQRGPWLMAESRRLRASVYALAAAAVVVTAGAGGVAAADPQPRDCSPEPIVVTPSADPVADALAHYARGRTLMLGQHHALAARELEAAARLAPPVPHVWRRLGEARFDSGDLAGAAEALDEALRLAPHEAAALLVRARTAQGLDRHEEAVALFQRLLEAAPKDSPYPILGRYYLAHAYQEQRDVDSAIANLRALIDLLAAPSLALRHDPEIHVLYRRQAQLKQMLGRLYLVQGRSAEAIDLLRASLAEAPANTELLNLLYHACIQAKDYAGARDGARQMIEAGPDAGAGYQRLVQTYVAEGRPADAIGELEAYLGRDPKNPALAFHLAAAYETLGQEDKAKVLYREAAMQADDPTGAGAAAAVKFADIAARQDKPLEALEVMGAALSGRRGESAVLIRAARLIDDLKDPASVYREAQRLLAGNARTYGPLVIVGMLAERIRQADDALEFYDRAIQCEPKAGIAYSRKADLLLQAQRHADALAVYQRALEAGLNAPVFHRKMGLILDHLGRGEEALEHFRRARQGAPDDKMSRYLLAATFLRLGRLDEAEAELRQLLEDFPTEVEAQCQLAALGLVRGKVEEAERLAEQAIGLDPASARARALLGEVRYRQGRYAECEGLAREVLKAQPGHTDARLLLAHALARQERLPEAVREVRALLAADPENIPWRYLLSGLHQQMGDQPTAERELLTVLQKKPDHAPSNNDLGYLWADRGINLDQAERMIRAALEADRHNPAYLDSLGWVLYKRGRFEEAARMLQRATELAPELDAVLWDHLGDSLWRLSRTQDAAKAWQKAHAILKAQQGKARHDDLDRVQTKLQSAHEGKTPAIAPLGVQDAPPRGPEPPTP
jgi:tetratricopeptide (TPR) repeat protein